jgi:alanine racemase
LSAIEANWHALDAASARNVETAAVVKANAYGLGADRIAFALSKSGVRTFFVALAEEGAALRKILGCSPDIYLLSGHVAGDADMIRDLDLIPVINSVEQFRRHMASMPKRPFAIQLETGMNRLGIQPLQWALLRDEVLSANPVLLMSHLACSDEVGHPMNEKQLCNFMEMTEGLGLPRSLSATGGIFLGPAYHFELTRPGIGIYGGKPFFDARPVVRLSLPVIQTREIVPGEGVGYGSTWVASSASRLATVSAGYADGLMRSLSNRGQLFSKGLSCPIVGRVSMDLITVDISQLDHVPDKLDILCDDQNIDSLATAAGTIGYEVLTMLGQRYERRYVA